MLLGSGLRKRILDFCFLNPETDFHVRDLAFRLKEDPGNVSREIRRLEGDGLLCSRIRGRLKLCSINPEHPLFKELRSVAQKTAGVEPLLTAALKSVPGVERAFLFGSYATGTMDLNSDIDLFVIGGHDTVALQKAVAGVQRTLEREINVVAMSPLEFSAKSGKAPFLKRLAKERKVVLI
jgi:predicted nucleotidyltransferase